MYLLDTCSYIWLFLDQDKLPKKVQEIIQYDDQELYFSSIIGFELGLLVKKKQIQLPLKTDEWLKKTQEFLDLQEIPVNKDTAFTSTQLPRIHNDPMDRILIATAMKHKLKILTPDKHIQKYKGVKTVW